MIRREFKINIKNLIIWLVILLLINTLVYAMYPSLSVVFESSLEEIMMAFPEEVLTAFNMDISSIATSFGWFKTEGIVMWMLIYGVYAVIMGSNILLKEESEGTIEYLYSKPVSKNKILFSKFFVGLINIIIMNIFLTIITLIGLSYNDDFDLMVIKLNTILLIPTVCLYITSLCISTFFKKTKQVSIVSFGLVFISYFLYSFSYLNDKVEFLRYFSFYTLADIRNLIDSESINIVYLIIFIFILIIITSITTIKYNKKELV